MKSKQKAAYFLAGVIFAAILMLVIPSAEGYKISDWINIFVAAGTLGAVIVAMYISLRQESLRNKENRLIGLLSLIRLQSKIDRIHLQCEILQTRVNNIRPFIDPISGSKSYRSSSDLNFHKNFIDDEEVQIDPQDLNQILHVDFQLAVTIAAALDNLGRMKSYSSNFQRVYPLLDQQRFDNYINALKRSLTVILEHFEKAKAIREKVIKEHNA